MTRLEPAKDTATIDDDGTVFAARLPDGPIVVLEGTATIIWSEACAGERETIADRVALATGAAVDEIRCDVEAFVDRLVARRLLREAGEDIAAGPDADS